MEKLPILLKMIGLWPPYLGAGIKVSAFDPNLTWIESEMKQRFWNNNYVGVHFGGSLYAMSDPFFMIILMHHLGKGYTVWDKAATIQFKSPGKGKVKARFEITKDEIGLIRAEVDAIGRCNPEFRATIVDEEGNTVAEVHKVLSVKRKK